MNRRCEWTLRDCKELFPPLFVKRLDHSVRSRSIPEFNIEKLLVEGLRCIYTKRKWIFLTGLSMNCALTFPCKNASQSDITFDQCKCTLRVRLYWSKSEIAYRWVHRESNLMFKLCSGRAKAIDFCRLFFDLFRLFFDLFRFRLIWIGPYIEHW